MVEGAPAHGSVAHLLPQTYKRLVAEWLQEDTPSFDYGGFVVGEDVSEAKLLGKSEVCRLSSSQDLPDSDTGHSGRRSVFRRGLPAA